MTRAFIYHDGTAAEMPFNEAIKRFGKVDLIWLYIDARDTQSADWLAAQTDIPDIALAALVAAETRPRSDPIGQGAITNLRGLGKTPEDDPDALSSVRLWTEPGRVISVCLRTPLALEAVVGNFLDGVIADPGDLLTDWAGRITDGLDPVVAALGDTLDDLEADLQMGMRRKVSRIRAEAIAFRRFVAPQRVALERLAATPCNWLSDDDRLHLREAADRFARMAEELESVRERAAIVHEELTDLRAEQVDSRGLFVSIIALIFLPLTFITGLFGMNFDYIPFQHDAAGFAVVFWGSFATAIGMTAFFLRRHWLER